VKQCGAGSKRGCDVGHTGPPTPSLAGEKATIYVLQRRSGKKMEIVSQGLPLGDRRKGNPRRPAVKDVTTRVCSIRWPNRERTFILALSDLWRSRSSAPDRPTFQQPPWIPAQSRQATRTWASRQPRQNEPHAEVRGRSFFRKGLHGEHGAGRRPTETRFAADSESNADGQPNGPATPHAQPWGTSAARACSIRWPNRESLLSR
jgi:hypothetical protein